VSKLTNPVDPARVRQMTENIVAKLVPQGFLDTAVLESLMVPAFV